MKRNLFYGVLMIAALVMISVGLVASSADDYKVVKQAAAEKSYTSAGDGNILHIEVYNKKTKKSEVNIRIPLSLVEMMADTFKDQLSTELANKSEEKTKSKGCGPVGNIKNLDFKKILKELKKVGPTSLIEIDGDDESVKIRIE